MTDQPTADERIAELEAEAKTWRRRFDELAERRDSLVAGRLQSKIEEINRQLYGIRDERDNLKIELAEHMNAENEVNRLVFELVKLRAAIDYAIAEMLNDEDVQTDLVVAGLRAALGSE